MSNKNLPDSNVWALKKEFDKRLSAFEAALRNAIGDKTLHDAVLNVYSEFGKDRGDSLALSMALAHICAEISGNVYCELEPTISTQHDAILIQMVTGHYNAVLGELVEARKGMTTGERVEMRDLVALLREHAIAEKAKNH